MLTESKKIDKNHVIADESRLARTKQKHLVESLLF